MKKTTVTFVGGPICGRVKKLPPEKLCEFVGYTHRGREYLYVHALKATHGEALRARHRYIFMGHGAALPDGVQEVD